MRQVLEAQEALLHDPVRLEAYRRALAARVWANSSVLDLGAGSGVLGLLALDAGAGHVFAVDHGPTLEIARLAARRNGRESQISFIRTHSQAVELPQLVDLVVCDQSGPLGWEGGLLSATLDAAARLVRPGGTYIPSQVSTWLAPAERPDIDARTSLWQAPIQSLDFSFLGTFAASTLWTVPQSSAGQFLALSREAIVWQPGVSNPEVPVARQLAFEILRRGCLSGFEGWFQAELAPGVTMTNGPDPVAINRPRRFFPLASPVQVVVGDHVTLDLWIRAAGPIARWSGTISRAGRNVASFDQNNMATLWLRGRQGA